MPSTIRGGVREILYTIIQKFKEKQEERKALLMQKINCLVTVTKFIENLDVHVDKSVLENVKQLKEVEETELACQTQTKYLEEVSSMTDISVSSLKRISNEGKLNNGVFSTPGKKRPHKDTIPDDGPFCELCNVRFVSSEALRRHIHVSARHTGSDKGEKESNKPKRPRKSREPGARERGRDSRDSSAERGRRYPSQLRKAEGPIPCEQCGMQLEDSRAYHGHFRRMHPDKNRTNYPSMKSPCMCEVCGRMFQSYALLKDHTWTHTGERPFSCDACGKAFRMKQRLVAHRRVHSAQRASYACGVCGKPFSTHSNRQRHMFIHTGLKPFKCEMCGKSFKHASEKRAHITYVHLKKPWPKRARGKRRQDRQSTQHPQMAVATGASEMDIVQPLWPSCDPKLADINALMDDKPMYYNLKI